MLALTATATRRVRDEIVSLLGLVDPLLSLQGIYRPNLRLVVRTEVKPSQRFDEIVELLQWAREGSAIVYAGTRQRTEELARDLAARGFAAAPYHAGFDGPERALVQSRFDAGEVAVMVATNAFGMGIDKADIRAVVHFRLPDTLEAYYQEVGRAGRDGERAVCLGYLGPGDLNALQFLVRGNNPWPSLLEREHARLRGLAGADGVVAPPPGELPRQQASERQVMHGYLERFGALERLGVGTVRVRTDWRGFAPDDRRWLERKREGDEGRLAEVERYAGSARCRMQSLAAYFGLEDMPQGCGHCDNCRPVNRPAPAPARRKRKASADGALPGFEAVAGSEDHALLERLRAWRLEAAEGRPAYTVLHDRTLAEIVRCRPRTADELKQVHGIGPSRLERYGDALLSIVRGAGA